MLKDYETTLFPKFSWIKKTKKIFDNIIIILKKWKIKIEFIR